VTALDTMTPEGAGLRANLPARASLMRRSGGGDRQWERWSGFLMLGMIVALCVLVPLLSPFGPNDIVADPSQSPSGRFWFGTDTVGRDLFVRVFTAGRLDLIAGVVAVAVCMIVGSVIGTVVGAGARRWPDTVVMRIVDAIVAFPFVILVLALVVIIGYGRTLGPVPAGVPAIVGAIIIVDWTVYARLARNETRVLSQADYVVAAMISGYPQWRIVLRHLMPGVIRATGTYAVADIMLIIVTIASLSFLGAGVQPPTPEWGSIMYEGRGVLTTAWWITTLPGVVLAITGLSIAFIADSFLQADSNSR
jgi:peptide/nickel transport system permease protein